MNRKEFIGKMSLGVGSVAFIPKQILALVESPQTIIKAIVVDYSKCTGCRTCEAVCSASNHQVHTEGKVLPGSGNPADSNIKVWRYHPPVDVPLTCFLCEDAPCVKACPVKPDKYDGKKALYRDEILHTIKCNTDRCIGCQSCSEACKSQGGGVIFPDESGSPKGMCTLCGGAPQCVQWCPYDALAYLEITDDMPHRGQSPDKISAELTNSYYQY